MPKQRITKEMVVDVAFEIARKGGMEKDIISGDSVNVQKEFIEFTGRNEN